MAFPHKRPKPRFSLFAADPLDPPAPKIRLADRIKASARTMPGIKVTSFVLGLSGGILAAAMFKHSCSTSAKTMTADVTSKLDHMRRQLENGGGVPHFLQDEVSDGHVVGKAAKAVAVLVGRFDINMNVSCYRNLSERLVRTLLETSD
jgi:hypothetical protein